jgi:protoporphyrinogen oxidase
MKIAILGAGLTGVELGRRLKELGKKFIILEKECKIGGLCQTNKTGDYYWDFAVHAIYSKNSEVTNYFLSLPLDYEHLNRNAKIFHSGSDGKRYVVEYPFEIGIKNLPLSDKLECIKGYFTAQKRQNEKSSNLKDWIDNRLGDGIAKHFMIPYNSKIWNCDLTEISESLVNSRVEPVSIINFMASILGKKVTGREYQSKFIYPKQGIQKLIDYAAKDIGNNVILDCCVKKLIRHNNKWTIITKGDLKEEADIVISTIPLPELLTKIDITGVKKEYSILKWNNTFFVMIGLKKGAAFQLINNCHWVFFKEEEIFYRVTLMHNFSHEFFPVLVAEITQKDYIINNIEEIVPLVIRDLIRKEIIKSENEIEKTEIKLKEYTYPIPTVGMEETRENIRNILKQHNMYLLGRSGNWDYINMDGVILNIQKFFKENSLLL